MNTQFSQRSPHFRRWAGRLATVGIVASVSACDAPDAGWLDTAVPEPTVFAPGVISADLRDYDIAFTPDGREAYFTRRSRRGPPGIYVSEYLDGTWTEPRAAPFASDRDEAPFITADGASLLFSSRRPHEGQTEPSDNLWKTDRQPDGWSTPEPLRGPVNQPRVEIGRYTLGTDLGPALMEDGSLLYWTRRDTEWGGDLYVARPDGSGGFAEPTPMRINSYGDEMNPVLSPGGRYIVFQAYRDAAAFGEQDLYAAERTDFGWGDPILLPEPVNSESSDGWPSFSPDGRFFFFASDRGRRAGFYDIYWVDSGLLGLPGLGGASP